MSLCENELKNIRYEEHFPVIYASASCYAALLRLDKNINVLFGPVSSVPMTYRKFYDVVRSNYNDKDISGLYSVIVKAPHIGLEQFAASMALFIRLVFSEDISVEDILSKHISLLEHNSDEPQAHMHDYPYGSISEVMDFQKKLLFNIRSGNEAEVNKIFQNTSFFKNLVNSLATAEDIRKMCFVYSTLCCMTVIEEKVDIQKVFPVFDTYVSKFPSLDSYESFKNMCWQMSIDYCRMVTEKHMEGVESEVVEKCMQYIHNNLHTRITITELAEYCRISARTITRHFMTYKHMTVTDYILTCKLEEAKLMLSHSDLSLVEISEQLAFSSQSHFTVAFKKKYYYTPQKYREKYRSR